MAELRPLAESGYADPRGFVDAFFSLMCPGLWASIDESRKDRDRANAEIGLADLRSGSIEVASADLGEVSIPALVIAGANSHPALRSVARRLAASLPDARFVELVDCGHVTYAEQPDQFARALSAFAVEVDRRTAPAR